MSHSLDDTSKSPVALYEKMYLVRSAELAIQAHYPQDGMKTPMHMSMGEEAIVAGVCAAIQPDGQVLGSYRSHALYLIQTGDLDGFMAEMYGKATGIVGGRGGSMHLLNPAAGVIGTSAIVASCIPLAAGAAFANRMLGKKRVVAVFFGDGAIDEGVFWESLNVACAMKLPVLFVCEDNDLAVHIPAKARHGYADIAQIVSKFECHVASSSSVDPVEIQQIAQTAVDFIKAGQGPAFLRLCYFRRLEHVGIYEDFKAGYRSCPDPETLECLDPVVAFRKSLLEKVAAREIEAIESRIDARVQESIRKAQAAPFPDPSTLCSELY
jgi:TPP-dependent pyruvate/acetoin dehydrogenase alpha subunit